ncbi:GAP family protein [Nocardiopsis sp. CA-288880]|uniref:GAP family protein n=1 Tax=Nocardiopsis sp. CA-288880 TaxID=3239995 RepID=UPI003D962559
MLSALGQVLPFVLGLIAGPIPIIALIFVLMAPGGRGKAVLYVVAWIAVVVVIATGVGLVAGGGDATAPGESPAWVAWVQLLLGALLVLIALKTLRGHLTRPVAAEPEAPSWMAAIDTMGAGRVMGLAALLAVANPKSLAMVLGGGAAIASFDLGFAGTLSAAMIFGVLGAIGLLVPLATVALSGARGVESLRRARTWLVANNDAVTMTVLFVFGGVFAAKGTGVLLG